MKEKVVLLGILTFLLLTSCEQLTEEFAFRNESLPLEERVDDLVSRMTLSQKISQMRYDAPAIDSLGIPEYNWWNECLHGVGRAGEATAFPQAIGMAASWDENLMHRAAVAISDEARAKHNFFANKGQRGIYLGLTFWTPNINIFRDPRWGRGQETYGEDPYLTGRMAVNFIKGLQGDDPDYLKLVATAKHFAVHSGPEKSRHSDNYMADDRDLWETYMPAFESAIVEGGAYSVMCAYNRYRDEACCGSNLLLQDILRNKWNFDGYVVSDCWAINDFYMEGRHNVSASAEAAAALAVKSGTDLNCGNTFPHLVKAAEQGLIPEAEIDKAVKRLFTARFKLGMFDSPEKVPYNSISHDVVASDAHGELSLQMARESMVLLKNEGKVLPLDKNIGSVAVIGPNADHPWMLMGNYNGTPNKFITPLKGIQAKLPNATVNFAQGSHLADGIPVYRPIPASALQTADGETGLSAQYFGNMNLEGEPEITRIDEQVDFIWNNTTPITGVAADTFSVRWEGKLVPEQSGTYKLGLRAYNTGKVYLNDELIVDFQVTHHPATNTVEMPLDAGTAYDLKVEVTNYHADPQAQLVWAKMDEDLLAPAVEAAKNSDVVLMFLGLTADIEGEEMPLSLDGFDGGDRTKLKLPDAQEELLKKVAATGKPVVLVLMSGSALAPNWAAQNVPAILEAWYPGESGGTAIADVLFGDYNPAGRLPVTFYKSVDDLPDFKEYSMEGRTYKYFKGEPLFPFGHGLSYTSFTYANLTLPETVQAGESITVSAEVLNAGQMDGDEVVQLYVSHVQNDGGMEAVPIRALEGFKRVSIAAGESQTVTFELSPEQLGLVDGTGRTLMQPGQIQITVGGKQPGFSGTADASTTQTVSDIVTVEGEVVEVKKAL